MRLNAMCSPTSLACLRQFNLEIFSVSGVDVAWDCVALHVCSLHEKHVALGLHACTPRESEERESPHVTQNNCVTYATEGRLTRGMWQRMALHIVLLGLRTFRVTMQGTWIRSRALFWGCFWAGGLRHSLHQSTLWKAWSHILYHRESVPRSPHLRSKILD